MSESFSWEKRSIENSNPPKGRNLKTYEAMLDLPAESLEGKVVLDLGSALGAKFAKDLQLAGINATVISVSPDFIEEKYRKQVMPSVTDKAKAVIRLKKMQKPSAVAALGEQLPFENESFDEVIALYSTSQYLLKHETWIQEACRVLKKDGELRAGPFDFSKYYTFSGKEINDSRPQLVRFLDILGYEYEFTGSAGFAKTRTGKDDSPLSLLILKKRKQLRK